MARPKGIKNKAGSAASMRSGYHRRQKRRPAKQPAQGGEAVACPFCDVKLHRMASGQLRCENWKCPRYMSAPIQHMPGGGYV